MQVRMLFSSWRRLAVIAAAAALFWLLRTAVLQAAVQLVSGAALALCALPLMKKLEGKLSAGGAAAVSLAAVFAVAAALLLLLVPPLIRQGRQLVSMLPGLYETAGEWLRGARAWMESNGLGGGLSVTERMGEVVRTLLMNLIAWLGGLAGRLGRLLLAPVFAYYFLRDRKVFAGRLLFCLPARHREGTVRICREVGRETAAYVRGQLMVSAIVGGLTAAGLLVCGVPAWLALGVMMGFLELIPYAGPVIGSVLAVLFSLPEGMARTLWALGVLAAVQQLEGSVLSPRMMSGATRLHPAAVLLCIVLGGGIGGVTGVLLSVPAVLCVRAALRVISLERMDKCGDP